MESAAESLEIKNELAKFGEIETIRQILKNQGKS